jgi:hypothetical protein
MHDGAEAISYALAAFPPGIAHDAERRVALMLGERLASGIAETPRSSRLTGDGFPFELGFCTADNRLRFTIEPGAEGLDPHNRLRVASELIGRMGGAPIPADVLDDLRAMQCNQPLQYGAWIGCRAGQGDAAFKLYAEVPPNGQTARLCPPPRLGDRIAAPRMVAYTAATGLFESYFRVPSLEPRHLPAVLAPAGMEAHAPALVAFVEDAYGYTVRGRLPGPSIGLSYVQDATESRVTVHFYARALWGSDARIRRSFSRVAGARGWDAAPYLHATAPMAGRESWKTFHGIFGITLAPSQPIALSIGVRPVEP